MRVTLGRHRLRVTQQLADDWQTQSGTGTYRRMGMPKVVDANACQACPVRHCLPRLLEIGARLVRKCSGNDVITRAREGIQDRQRRRVQHHRFLPRFGGRQQQQTTLEIDLVPFEVQNFSQSRARENQQSDCGGGVRADDGAAVGLLRGVLGLRLRFIHRVRQPDSFGFPDRFSDPRQFRCCQIPLASFFPEMFDTSTRVETDGYGVGLARESEQTA